MLTLGWQCTLRCLYCPYDKSKTESLSVDAGKKAIDIYFDYYDKYYPGKRKEIYFYGG